MQIKFSYPRRGLSGVVNTIRPGAKWADRCPVGTEVELVDSRTGKLLKRAEVMGVFTGTLETLAHVHAKWAHNWKEHPEDERPGLLVASLKKRYPPGRILDTTFCAAIYLREVRKQ